MKIFLFFLSLATCYVLLAPSVSASEFETSYDMHYSVNEEGMTHVQTAITLTNLVTNLFATQYAVTVRNTTIENVRGFDKKGPLAITTKKETEETRITAIFNDKVVGKGNALSFSLEYDSPDIGRKVGSIWEVTIPKAASGEAIGTYQSTLTVPQSFGPPLYFKPNPKTSSGRTFRWGYDELKRGVVTAAFGVKQVYAFSLTYHLANPSDREHEEEIALPPDTAYQKVMYTSIEPPFRAVSVDSSGNWLARFGILANSKQDIIAKGFVEVGLTPRSEFPSPTDTQAFLLPTQHWPSDDPDMLALAKTLRTPRAIYDYVVRTLSYDYARVTTNASRLGAKAALLEPKRGTCTEFTDLTITLLRAAGIPAREVNGYAYTTNSHLRPLSLIADVLHAWPEYFDAEKNLWIPIDPTWGNTTGGVDYFSLFDVEHIAFVIHGEKSDYPYPAGAYKLAINGNVEVKKDITIDVDANPPDVPLVPLAVDISLPQLTVGNTETSLFIKNPNPVAIYHAAIRLIGEGIRPIPSSILLDPLPPYATRTVSVKIDSLQFWPFGKKKLIVDVSGNRTVATADSPVPLIVLFLSVLFGFITLVILLFLIMLRIKRRRR